ncbi:peptidase [Ahniella affigens]|nr:peptidase [Ahniella affigens]
MSKSHKPIEVFRAGKHRAVDGHEYEITTNDLQQIAEAYSPQKSEAPLVIGHPELEAPAYGWVKSLSVQNGLLLAEPHQVNADFAEGVNRGAYKKVSASFFTPSAPRNPTPGKYYLRHIGFLGATPPAVKGLRDASFADGEQGVVSFGEDSGFSRWYVFREIAGMFRRLRDSLIERDGVEKADLVIPAWSVDVVQEAATPPEQSGMVGFAEGSANAGEQVTTEGGASAVAGEAAADAAAHASFADREAALAARAAELEVQATELATRANALAQQESAIAAKAAREARRAEVASFAETLVDGGRLHPRNVPLVVELLAADQPGEISFAEGDATVTEQWANGLRRLLSDLPQVISFAERSGDPLAVETVSFAAPENAAVDPERLAIHHRAIAHQKANPGLSYLQAVAAVSQ